VRPTSSTVVAPGNGEWLDFRGPCVETGQIYSW
jgi:hypothetical protein